MDSTTADHGIGQRIREVRVWRGLSLRAAGELAGLSAGHFSNIERGHRRIDKRSTLEAIASALRVSPADLTGQPWLAVDADADQSDTSLVAVETALEIYELGQDPGGAVRQWPEVAADIIRLQDLMHVHADYAGQAALVPHLMAELHAMYARGTNRENALLGLVHCYSSAVWITKRLDGRGLPGIAARMAAQCANELGRPEWMGYAAWLRGDATGALSRSHQYDRSVRMADELSRVACTPDITQAHGMLHLSSALAAAALNDKDTASTHLAEASEIANRMDDEVGKFARLWFGRQNVGVWQVSIACEFGDMAKVSKIAPSLHPEEIPSPSRNAEFLCDVGRSLVNNKSTREAGIRHILKAETLAPQRVRNDAFVREAVGSVLRQARRDAGGRELRGMAYRMGLGA